MAITLRNKPLERRIRALAEAYGIGPSAAIARAIAGEEERLEAVAQERRRRMDRWLSRLPSLTQAEAAALDQAERSIHGEDGLPA